MTYTPEERRKAADALMSDKDSRIRVDVDRYITLQCHVNALRDDMHDLLLDVGVLNSRSASEDAIDTTRYEAVLAQTSPKEPNYVQD